MGQVVPDDLVMLVGPVIASDAAGRVTSWLLLLFIPFDIWIRAVVLLVDRVWWKLYLWICHVVLVAPCISRRRPEKITLS
jgi:hypothetical protein